MSKAIPRIFLCSTVHDLYDVRAAIRFVLKRDLGCQVFSSEFSDFPVDPNLHSYEVCLRNLEVADVLILVINKRYGGIAENDSTTEVSISRKEFRKARPV